MAVLFNHNFFEFRRPNDPIRSKARRYQPPQSINRGDLLLCRHRVDIAILLRQSWHATRGRCERLLVHLNGLQYRCRRQQSPGTDLETGHVVCHQSHILHPPL
jgi:hypothetical protein